MNSDTGRVYISRDDVFVEGVFPFVSKSHVHVTCVLTETLLFPSLLSILVSTTRNLEDGGDYMANEFPNSNELSAASSSSSVVLQQSALRDVLGIEDAHSSSSDAISASHSSSNTARHHGNSDASNPESHGSSTHDNSNNISPLPSPP